MKDKIMRQTFRLLLKRGLYGVSISDIQNSLDISRALIYHHFKNKEDLQLQTCKLYFLERYNISDEELSKYSVKKLFERVNEIRMDLMKELELENEGAVFVQNYNLLFYQASQKYSELMLNLKDGLKNYVEAIRSAQENGEIIKTLEPEFIARFFFYVFDGSSNYMLLFDEENSLQSMNDEIMRFYSMIKASPKTL